MTITTICLLAAWSSISTQSSEETSLRQRFLCYTKESPIQHCLQRLLANVEGRIDADFPADWYTAVASWGPDKPLPDLSSTFAIRPRERSPSGKEVGVLVGDKVYYVPAGYDFASVYRGAKLNGRFTVIRIETGAWPVHVHCFNDDRRLVWSSTIEFPTSVMHTGVNSSSVGLVAGKRGICVFGYSGSFLFLAVLDTDTGKVSDSLIATQVNGRLQLAEPAIVDRP